jgi:hypothetical protein
MDTMSYVYLGIGGVLLIGIIVALFLNKDYLKYSGICKTVLNAVKLLLGAAGQIGLDKNAVEVATKIVQAAIEGTVEAENLWKQGQLDKEKRNEYAQTYIETTLAKAGINLNEQAHLIVNGVITLVCYLLPHNTQPEA